MLVSPCLIVLGKSARSEEEVSVTSPVRRIPSKERKTYRSLSELSASRKMETSVWMTPTVVLSWGSSGCLGGGSARRRVRFGGLRQSERKDVRCVDWLACRAEHEVFSHAHPRKQGLGDALGAEEILYLRSDG
jgi:hypothetical protein